MKKLLIIITVLLVTVSCKNDDDNTPTNPIEQLPPVTQTGANTFGCLLDGEVFLPGTGTRPTTARYEFVNGGYYLTIGANRENRDFNLVSVGCLTENLEIFQGKTYDLVEKQEGKAYGRYFFATEATHTSQIKTGKLTITKLDLDQNIISGTFWFDIVDWKGVDHQIREGRFDMKFTQ